MLITCSLLIRSRNIFASNIRRSNEANVFSHFLWHSSIPNITRVYTVRIKWWYYAIRKKKIRQKGGMCHINSCVVDYWDKLTLLFSSLIHHSDKIRTWDFFIAISFLFCSFCHYCISANIHTFIISTLVKYLFSLFYAWGRKGTERWNEILRRV